MHDIFISSFEVEQEQDKVRMRMILSTPEQESQCAQWEGEV